MGSFSELNIDYAKEYRVIRDALSKKGCDYSRISYACGMLYLNCEDEQWSEQFRSLLSEITQREMMSNILKLRKI